MPSNANSKSQLKLGSLIQISLLLGLEMVKYELRGEQFQTIFVHWASPLRSLRYGILVSTRDDRTQSARAC